LVRSATVTVLAIDDADLPALEGLMSRYADRPMDFADATLVRRAERERLSTIFTIDHDDFETYRIEGRRRFRIVPDR
jgi:predicted nucleic acid-binding protein